MGWSESTPPHTTPHPWGGVGWHGTVWGGVHLTLPHPTPPHPWGGAVSGRVHPTPAPPTTPPPMRWGGVGWGDVHPTPSHPLSEVGWCGVHPTPPHPTNKTTNGEHQPHVFELALSLQFMCSASHKKRKVTLSTTGACMLKNKQGLSD